MKKESLLMGIFLNLFRLTKPQKMGFAIVCQDIDGNLIKDKTKVIVLN